VKIPIIATVLSERKSMNKQLLCAFICATPFCIDAISAEFFTVSFDSNYSTPFVAQTWNSNSSSFCHSPSYSLESSASNIPFETFDKTGLLSLIFLGDTSLPSQNKTPSISPDVVLSISNTDGNVVISYGGGTLTSSPTADGAFSPVDGSSSPFTVITSAGAMFYKVQP
jgi:hypothetical protein